MTPALIALRDLQSRVREATGPSRELDARIWQAVVSGATNFTEGFGYSVQVADEVGHPLAPRLTASIDEAVAFVERVLPGFFWTVQQWPDGYRGNVTSQNITGRDHSGPTPALALLSAAMTALIAKAEQSAALDAIVEIGQVEGMP